MPIYILPLVIAVSLFHLVLPGVTVTIVIYIIGIMVGSPL